MRSYLDAKLILFKKFYQKNVIITDKSIDQFSEIKKISIKKQLKLTETSKIEKN